MEILEEVRQHLRKNRFWISFRQAQKEGLLSALRRYQLWATILRTDPVETDEQSQAQPVEVHLLCYWRDYLTAIWALKTFYWQSGVRYPLVIHTNGIMPRRSIHRLRRHFPNARIIEQPEANVYVEQRLQDRGLARLLEWRRSNSFMLKLTDFVLFSEATNILTLDSDILFFSEPLELRGGEGGKLDRHWFQEDPTSNYNITEEYARERFQIELQPRLNSGIMLFSPDPAALEMYEILLADPQIACSTGWIEQTLFAMHASARGRVALWPKTYQLTLDGGLQEGVVARHYAGPTRPLLTLEGMPALLRRGLTRPTSYSSVNPVA